MTYIKTLTAPLIIIAGLALLTACGGGATPDEESNEDPVVNCTEAPFDSVDMCEDQKNTFCSMSENIFNNEQCMDLDNINDIRTTFCSMSKNIFDHAECEKISNINNLRMTYCEMPDKRFNADCITNNLGGDGRTTFCSATNIFHPTCLDNTYGGDGERDTACQAHGTNVGAGGHASCDGRIRTACVANPFMHLGCDTLDDKIRTDFCAILPANRFNAQCISRDIGDDDDRDDTCEMYGITPPMGHSTCDGRIRTACVANPFEHLGCNSLEDKIRTDFCAKTENLFDMTCITRSIGDHDDNRDTACLTSPVGVPVHPSCANRPGVIQTCTTDPFLVTNTGCENLDTIISIKEVYCGTAANFAKDICTVKYADWEASFGAGKAPMTTPNATRRNEFLNAGDGTLSSELEMAFGSELMAESITILNLSALEGGDATDGVAYFIFEDSGQQYHYAGLLSSTDLGAPSFQETGTAIWKGEFNATKLDQKSDFDLEVTFGGGSGDVAGSIEAFVASGDEHFLLKGDYDAKGVISGTVNYGTFTTGTRTPTGSRVDNGILTGLIGRQGAVGVFLSGTGAKDNITGGTGIADGFAGGFVANPFDGNVSYSDWVTEGGPPPAPTATTPVKNEFLQTTRNDLNIGTITGTAVHFNFATATYEDVALGGSATNGFTAFISTANNYYAGITSTTILGEALVQTKGTGAWKGSFVAYEGGTATTTDFELMIEFAATSKVSATIGDYSFDGTDVGTDGTFGTQIALNRQGVTSAGTISGIIGQKGAVGVFWSDATDATGFSGGFVAVPEPCVLAGNCVANHAAWVDSFGASPPPATRVAANAGTAAFGSFLNLAEGVRNISPADLTALNTNRHLTLDGNNGDGMHGVTYLVGKNEMKDQAFVAVLPTTNLGAPLVAQPTIGRWPGTYYNSSFSREEPINFDIVFGANTIKGTHAATQPFPVTTTFALDFTYTGVITGNVTQGSNTATARGLIGEVGLVGVFVDETPIQSENTAVFFGGFVADNPNN